MTTAVLETQTAPRRKASQPSRRQFFDFARLIAALAIVWLHSMTSPTMLPSISLGRFAVPFFTAAAVFLICESLLRGKQRTFLDYTRNRFNKLYVPFLAWTAIYLLFKLAKSFVTPEQPNDFPGVTLLVTGGFYHLWFLPFVFLISLLTFGVVRTVVGSRTAETRLGLATAAIGAVIAFAPIPTAIVTAGSWTEYWWMALPAAFWGVTLMVIGHQSGSRRLETTTVALCGLGITIVATAWTWHVGRSVLAENLAGLGFLLFALAPWHGKWVCRLATLGPLAYGIYLSHLLFIKTCEAVATKLDWSQNAALDVAIFAVAAVGSTALTWMLSRYRTTRWLVA